MRWVVVILSVLVATGFSGELWFDFSTPVVTYLISSLRGWDGMGIGFGGKFGNFPGFEIALVRNIADGSSIDYLVVKPLIFHGNISDLKVGSAFGDVGFGFDVSLKDMEFLNVSSWEMNLILTSGLGVEFSTKGRSGVFARIKMEIAIRIRLFGEIEESPYYIKLFGPIYTRPLLALGGKF